MGRRGAFSKVKVHFLESRLWHQNKTINRQYSPIFMGRRGAFFTSESSLFRESTLTSEEKPLTGHTAPFSWADGGPFQKWKSTFLRVDFDSRKYTIYSEHRPFFHGAKGGLFKSESRLFWKSTLTSESKPLPCNTDPTSWTEGGPFPNRKSTLRSIDFDSRK